jgi:thiosulfate/3-mercaptopyruvate sulfurtransferase
MSSISDRGYAVPEILVSTAWVAEHLDDPSIRIVESDEDPLLYASSHLPGAVEVDWTRDLNDPVRRDYLQKDRFDALMAKIGVTKKTVVVFYGDKNNWWAAYAAWVFHLFGHENIRLMDGGRLKWEKEGRPLTRNVPHYDKRFRAFRDQVMQHVAEGKKLIDVRSPEEFSGQRLHMENYPNEGALRGGHIPGAKNIPWAKAVDPTDGTFLPAPALKELYQETAGLSPADDVVVYCRIGERSAHTWFVLRYLLGFPEVRNYDGSWTEWGNLVGAPVER